MLNLIEQGRELRWKHPLRTGHCTVAAAELTEPRAVLLFNLAKAWFRAEEWQRAHLALGPEGGDWSAILPTAHELLAACEAMALTTD